VSSEVSRSTRRAATRVLAGLLLGVILYGAAELCAFGAFWVIFGEAFSFARMAAERESRAYDTAFGDPVRPAAQEPEVIHPYLGYVKNPEVRAPKGRQPNAFGFLGAEPPIFKRREGRVIVAFLGGSFAQSLALRGRSEFARALERDKRFADVDVVIVPLALAGYKQPQQLMTVAYLLSLGAQFDIIINVDGFNEVALHEAENANHGVFPAFPRNWFARVSALPDPQLRALVGEVAYVRMKQMRWAARFPYVLRYCITANLIWRIEDRRLSASIATLETALQRHGAPSPGYVATGPRLPTDDASTVYPTLVSIWKESSLQLGRLAQANGALYFHFLQPNQYVQGSKPMGSAERRRSYDPSQPYRRGVERGYPLLREAGAELERDGVEFSDLTMLFANNAAPIYIDTCCHMNDDGIRAVVDEIAASILRSVARER